jgi:hypothetical protein
MLGRETGLRMHVFTSLSADLRDARYSPRDEAKCALVVSFASGVSVSHVRRGCWPKSSENEGWSHDVYDSKVVRGSIPTMFNKTPRLFELAVGRRNPASSRPQGWAWPARTGGEARLFGHHYPAGPNRLGRLFTSGPWPAQRLSRRRADAENAQKISKTKPRSPLSSTNRSKNGTKGSHQEP